MAKGETQREIAQRYHDQYTAANPRTTYYRRWHPLRKERFFLTCGVCALGALWVVGSWVLGDQTLWSRGPLAVGHRKWERDCAACHTGAFAPVRDETCLGCHRVGAHVPAARGADPACGTCHAEHRGRESLASVGEAHCNVCHEDHHGILSFDDHGPLPPLELDQHIRFDHKAHLDPELPGRLRLPGFELPLACGDCHEPAGEGFRAVSFDAHCARCHKEMLDPGAADVTIPHGVALASLRTWIAGFYATHARDGTPSAAPRPAEEALADAEAAWRTLAGQGKTSCALCHEIDASDAAAPRIVEPRIPEHWRRPAAFDPSGGTPLARFDHRAHRFAIRDAPPGPEGNCLFCHSEAARSIRASDLNLPRIESCRECHVHGGAETSCSGCHPFHTVPPR